MNKIDTRKNNKYFILFLIVISAIPLYVIIYLVSMAIPIAREIHDFRMKAILIRPLAEGIIVLLALISISGFVIWKAKNKLQKRR